MKILVTAGGTFTPIDQVRGITNVFNGRTGVEIARHFAENDNDVLILIKKKSPYMEYLNRYIPPGNCREFSTYDDLYSLMEEEITEDEYDVVIHSAAVSDYKVDGVYSNEGSRNYIHNAYLEKLPDVGKYKSNYEELFLRLIKTEKIIDKIRKDWGFKGVLVKFKLEVGIDDDEELISIARESRVKSGADIIVANCLEWAKEKAYVISKESVTGIQRDLLPHYLYGEICKIV